MLLGGRKGALGGPVRDLRASLASLWTIRCALFGIGVLAGSGLLAGSGCNRDHDLPVVTLDGWRLTLPQLATAYDRANGTNAFAGASSEQRETFARSLADHELMLRLARQEVTELNAKQARIYRISYEKTLQREFDQWRREHYVLSPDVEREQLPRILGREARVRLMRLSAGAAADRVVADLDRGASFEEIAEKYGAAVTSDRGEKKPGSSTPASPPPVRWQELVAGLRTPELPPVLINQALVLDLPEGGITRPFPTPGGTMLLQVVKYQPVPGIPDSSARERARGILAAIGQMTHDPAWSDSLRKASGLSFSPNAYPIIQARMATFWDSIGSGGPEHRPVDFQALQPPIWLFTTEEQSVRLCTLRGSTMDVGDFVNSLANIDLDSWPTVGPIGKIAHQIEVRVQRLLLQSEAERVGVAKTPAFVEAMQRVREKCVLNQYRELLAERLASPTPGARIDSLLQAQLRASRARSGLKVFSDRLVEPTRP